MADSSMTTRLGGMVRSFIAWLDAGAAPPPPAHLAPADDKKIEWLRVIPFIGLHLMCLGVFFVGWSWFAVGFAVALYLIRMFAITGFYHRYFSHRTFKTSRLAQFLFAVLGNSAAQRGPLWWAAHHRHHHRHSDTDDDPHSPHTHGLLWSHMLWFTNRSNFATRLHEVKDLAKYPELRFIDRFDIVVPTLLGFGVYGLGILLEKYAPGLGTNGPQLLIWGFFVSTIVLFHGTCTINSLSHLMGRKRYDTGDESRNSLILALVTLGEGWHNNHHYYPASTRQGFFWWEIDITYYVLRVMAALGIIWDLKGVPEHVRNNTRRPRGSSHDSAPPPAGPTLPEAV